MDRKTKRYAALTALLILCAYALRFAPDGGHVIRAVRGTIYTGIIVTWGFSVHRRVIHTQIKRLFAAIACLMVFWMCVRTLKFSLSDPNLCRYLWYFYYIPMLFIPLCAFLLSMWLGKPESYRLPKWTGWLCPAAAGLAVLVLTNDFHQTVFTFPAGAQVFTDLEYSYGPLFPLVFGFRIAGLLVTVSMIFFGSRVPHSRRRLILPMIPSALLLVYGLLYVCNAPYIRGILEDLTVMECMLVVAILECCLRCGLIQSNIHYAELFKALGYPIVLVDEAYAPVYMSDAFAPLPVEVMRQAEDGAVELKGGLVLKHMPVRGGAILWTEDVAELMALKEQADSVKRQLSEEKDLLQAEIEMKQKQAVLDTRNRLYDSAAYQIFDQFAEIDRLVSGACLGEEERKAAMRRMCVIGAYIKRRCNLLFIGEEQEEVSSDELVYCLRESADYIRFYGAPCALNTGSGGTIPASGAKLAYDLFERVAETVLETLSAMLIFVEVRDGCLRLNIQFECGVEEIDFSDMETGLREQNGLVSGSREDGILYTRISLAGGGVQK